MLQLAICERFDATAHGVSSASAKGIEGHYLIESIDLDDFYSGDYKEFRLGKGVDDAEYEVRLELVEAHELDGGEAVGLLKTHALKRLQRKCRQRQV